MASLIKLLVAATALLSGPAAATPTARSRGCKPHEPTTTHVYPLRRLTASVNRHSRLFAGFRSLATDATPGDEGEDPNDPLTGGVRTMSGQLGYYVEVEIGNATYPLIVDTGSSDTWVAGSNFKCVMQTAGGFKDVAVDVCGFGKLYQGDFPGGKVEDMHMNVSYGYAGGPFLTGDYGYADLVIAGIPVQKQQIAIARRGYWDGYGTITGILGLGLARLTRQYKGTDPALDTNLTLANYDPVVTTIGKQHGFGANFAIAIARNESESFISFGGIPPVKTTEFVPTPVVKWQAKSGDYDFYYYMIQPGNVTYANSTTTASEPLPSTLIDSGTTLNLLPYEMAKSINAMYEPPAVFSQYWGQWFVPCNATPPTVDIDVGGKLLRTDPSSLILPDARDAPSDSANCATGIGAAGSPPYILGDTFLQGLVAHFDADKLEVRFAKRL